MKTCAMYQLNPQELAMLAITGYGALQKHQEFSALLKMLAVHEPKVIVEIGIGKGGSTWAFSKLQGIEQHIIIDLPGGGWGGESEVESKKVLDYISQNSSGCPIQAIFGNSQNSECLAILKEALGDRQIDFLFIDGAHDYVGVKTDYLTYSVLVRSGGLIALHDIAKHTPETGCEVEKFWTELKESGITPDLYTEFIEVTEPSWGGLGIVRW